MDDIEQMSNIPYPPVELEEYEMKDYSGSPEIELSSDEDFEEESETTIDDEILERLESIEFSMGQHTETLDALKVGINTIGEMMNGVAGAFDQIMAEVQKGGVAGLLGTLMGGKKNG